MYYPKQEVVYHPTTGNIQTKTDLNNLTMSYGESDGKKPHALTGIDGLPDLMPYNQAITYTDFKKVKTISENGKLLTINYGTDEQRIKSVLTKPGSAALTRYYMGDYEEEIQNGNVRKIHYICGGNGLAAVLINDSLFYAHTDYQGSLIALSLPNGTVRERYAYDPWGNRRNPENWTERDTRTAFLLNRGYTMHEHLDDFKLINMNGRVYDPLTAQFFSPDPYVQAPDNWLNYNRYSYCINNPFKYTDPSGEWFGIDDLIVAGAGFVVGYVSHGLSSGNWGWSAVASGGMGAVSSWLGFNTMGASSTMGAWQFAGYNAANTAVSSFMPSANIPIGDHFGLSMSPGFMFGPTGATTGLNFGLGYHNGDLAVGAGFGVSNSYTAWNVAATYKGWGAGYGETHYGASDIMGHHFDAQTTGSITAYFNGNSVRIENDTWGDGKDRWRTNAAELTIGKWSLGTHLYTNFGADSSPGLEGEDLLDNSANCIPPKFFGIFNGKNNNDGKSTWKNGRPYYAPFWVGYRHGNQVTRFGYSNSFVHNNTQNLVHKGFGNQNYYMSYDEFRTGGFYSTGTYNPFSLYNR
jgi:RHS repeat-associated protein